ncbi:MAG: membrane protein insertase YidC [Treponema sp.]|nr:membrane protein insertase YidC [Treponema sp.]
MNKNSILAIALSTVVVMVSLFINQRILQNKVETASYEEQTVTSEVVNSENSIKNKESLVKPVNNKVAEETITINTEKAEIVLTNRGGDIISYKLISHKDIDTNEGVQLVDNVTEMNRACAVSFGGVNNPIINDVFNVDKISEYEYLFTKEFKVESNGTYKSFILGKRYKFDPNDYMFKLDVLIHNNSEDGSLDFDNVAYTIRTSPQIGPHFNPKLNKYENRQFVSYNGNKAKKIILSKNQIKEYNKDYIWDGIVGKYFANLVVPENHTSMGYSYYSSEIEVDDYANAQALLVRKPITEVDSKDTYYFYYGPRNEKELKIYNVSENNPWNLSGLRLTEALQSSGWLGWLETILKWVMELLYKLIPNWGVSIILMTILLKLAMFPFTRKQSLSTLKMQEIQPKIQAVQEKYRDNPQKQQEMLAKVYQEAGYNPMSGCLPMIVQFFVLFAMYNLFNNYFEFRGASFIPHWIDDLSVGDSVYTLKVNLPFLGNHIRILPLIYLASQLFYGKITNNGGAAPTSGKFNMNLMMYGMPILFFFIFYNAPSGLLLYWTVSNIIQMVQQIVINKIMKQKKAELAKK